MSAFLTWKIKKVSLVFGWLDKPSQRKIHTKPVVRLGGVAVWLAFWLIVGTIYFLDRSSITFVAEKYLGIDKNLLGVFLGSLLLLGAGIWDDIKGLKPGTKLIFHFLAGIIIVAFGIKIHWFANPLGGLNIELGNWTYLFVPLWIVLIINVVNWLDGIDGLAVGISGIASVILGFLSLAPFVNQFSTANLAFILAGVCVGFLVLNFNPAKIFLGDSGSMFLGFMLAIFAIISGGKLATAALVLGLPILDAFWVISRRLMSKKAPWQADKLHLHHRFLAIGFSQRQTVLVMYAIAAIFGMIALSTRTGGKVQAALWLVALMVALGAGLVLVKSQKSKVKSFN
ncbi:MAG: Glycosyl transferase, family 4 [Candidatus Berkelbacteria bacterium Licking1014_7]|uniref:Glycosyl transferase, family 4 n=1 Tax=Candidatus Berkelbacteria bacterium Licking1014_7 TaxID=2017147 RepID=A0A554LJF8_9BACT|nr:MAG: Glycosyl transferase, family 4 [Candidatus Berkelbacteria bacterium Licking1014_7]